MEDQTDKRPPWLAPMTVVPPTEEIREAAANREAEQALEKAATSQDTANGVQDDRKSIDMRTLGSRALLERMNPQSRALRELFAQEYIYDFDPVRAAQRCGYLGKKAVSAARRLMSEPAVQRLIKERQSDFGSVVQINQNELLAALWREGNREDLGSSHSARVAALGKIAQIVGIAKPEGETNVNIGGVMLIPPVAEKDSWEKSAMTSQENLKNAVHD